MLFRIPAVAAGLLLSAVSIPAQTFTIHTYASNNLWNINGGPNAHAFADLNEDGREDFVSLNDGSFNSLCSGSFAVALSNGDGTFQPEKVIFQTNDWIGEWHVMRATHSSRPDLAVWESESTNHTNWNTEQLVLVNMTAGNFPACTPPNFSATGVNHCGPTSSVGATSPVTFKFAGANPTAGRDMELWIDGKKVTQKFKHSFSHYDFLQQTVTLANGEHKVSVVSVGWDYSLIRDAFTLKVGSSVCPLPGGSGLNVCSPLQNSTVPASQPVSAYVRGKVPSGNAITRMELWVDGVKKYVTYGSNTLKTALSLSPGQHKLAYVLVDNAGTTWSDAYDVAAQ